MPYTPEQVIEKYRDTAEAAKPTRMELAYRFGTDMCYVEGVQWIQPARQGSRTGLGRMKEDYSPDSSSLRVVDNYISLHAQKVAAGTEPRQILMDGEPAQMDTGVEGAFRARVSEEAVNVALDKAGYLQMAQDANYNATVTGTWGIGLSARFRTRKVAGADEPDWDIRAFDFDPTCLILDPAVRNRDLSQHDCVMYEDFWTYRKIIETFPQLKAKINESDLRTFEDLDPARDYVNKLSGGRIYSALARYSKTKGAMVCQVHERDESGRFPTMWVIVCLPGQREEVVNADNPVSPFGGGGLPFQLIYGHRRTDVLWGMSDVSMMRADQDKLNLNRTLAFRILQKYAHGRTYVDKRFFNNAKNDDDIIRKFTNMVNGVVVGDLSDKSRGVSFPHTEYGQQPPPFLDTDADRSIEAMRKKSHKSEGNFGETKTHVGNEQAALARDDAAEVRDARIRQFTGAHERLVGVLWATTIKNVKEGNPSTLAGLQAKGFDADKFSALIAQDEYHPAVSLKVREETFRPRSLRQKRQDIDAAANLQQITPIEARLTLAKDLQTPATARDQAMADEANKAARLCLAGQPWLPRPLGVYGQFFVAAFQDATFDPRAQNPQVMQVLQQAIMQQSELDVQEQIRTDPTLRVQSEQAAAQQAQVQAQAAQEQAPEQSSVADLLAQLSGTQPAAETAAA